MLMVLLATEALKVRDIVQGKNKAFKCIIQKHAFLAEEQLRYSPGTCP